MKINEKNFIKKLINKDEQALIFVMDNYGYLIKKIINKHLFYLENYKEDCLNEVFLAIWENIEDFDSEISSFTNWICVIAKYKSIDYLRKYLEKSKTENIEELNISVEPEKMEIELIEEFEDLISPLNEEDKEIFRNRFYDEISYDIISQKMNLSKGAVYNRVLRGKKKIREYLEQGGRKNE
ncbi:MAG: sigma-70 family RNA polymerase sigma factor [Miniphocaeibacter sp.]|uniref:sigma-70 family RNA polymerase sigma factor n=1 Tax=Miniphocaeibacter sp. TaxID=3100973 RepID=UPI0018401798|nr:sigma-70 family RNA polymerase sigma factor [Gallicola sp.]